ncbi:MULTISPECIES: aminotransferase class IV [unclassified Meiothermus]|uniref:aminotransferase class IV n=1 Tax=unclassified Meiothermus TaxID=370471 RepID=UPI000D7BB16D|nr:MULTISPECIES: aminotransferase class IV [unclassified Meiothermus]PZA07254.1 aminotransferase IV [Meiothermus sp. Pnk-1]RYM37988.1 aminotransferase IV [Meiothermus sp. PNK-Is4]
MAKYVVLNGELVPEAEAKIHISDLGLRRGYAAFEFFRVVRGIPLFFEDHLERFQRSAELLFLDAPWPPEEIRRLVFRLVEANASREAGVQLVLTGGYSPDAFTPTTPNLIIAETEVRPYPAEQYEQGVKVITQRNLRELPEAKTTDYLMAVRLIPRMRSLGAVEVLYHDGRRMLEGARSGLGIVTQEGVLVTAGRDVLESVTRRRLLGVARELLPVERRDISLEEFFAAPEVFLLSSTRGVMPVTQVDERKVGSGQVGPHTRRLMQAFQQHVEEYLTARASLAPRPQSSGH